MPLAQRSQNSSQVTVLRRSTKWEHLAAAMQNTLLLGTTPPFTYPTRLALKVCSSLDTLSYILWPFLSCRSLSLTQFWCTEAATFPLAFMTAALGMYYNLRLPSPWFPTDLRTPLIIYGGGIRCWQFCHKVGNPFQHPSDNRCRWCRGSARTKPS